MISPSRIGNPDLKPERQTEIEIGADLALLNNRLGIEFTYYDQDIQDLLLERTLSPSTGATSRIENIGTMTNKGYEIFITGVPVQTLNFKWTITGTFSSNKNDNPDRFIIHLKNVTGIRDGLSGNSISMYVTNRELSVLIEQPVHGQISLINAMGQVIFHEELERGTGRRSLQLGGRCP